MAKRFLFCTGEGIGNIIQTIPAIRTIVEQLDYRIDFWQAFGSYKIPKIIPYVDEWFNYHEVAESIDPRRYTGKVATPWAKDYLDNMPIQMISLKNEITRLTKTRSEVDTYMDIARDLGIEESKILWHGECLYNPSKFKYDVAIHDGYNKKISPNRWVHKSYPHYNELVKLLKSEGLSVCSVGSNGEHIKGTDNRCGMALLDTLGLIKNAKLFIGNDSGLYHCANALKVPNIVVFTYTSVIKNYDPRFHRYAAIAIRNDIDCTECQDTDRYNKCISYECKEIKPETIFEMANKILKDGVEPNEISLYEYKEPTPKKVKKKIAIEESQKAQVKIKKEKVNENLKTEIKTEVKIEPEKEQLIELGEEQLIEIGEEQPKVKKGFWKKFIGFFKGD